MPWHPIIEASATASSEKNIPGLILFDQSCNIMQILLVIDDIAWKKLRYTLKSPTQAKLFWHFPFFYFISLQVEKKFHSCSYLLPKAAAFRLCELARRILANEK